MVQCCKQAAAAARRRQSTQRVCRQFINRLIEIQITALYYYYYYNNTTTAYYNIVSYYYYIIKIDERKKKRTFFSHVRADRFAYHGKKKNLHARPGQIDCDDDGSDK